ncbi:MAG: hypothetical protein HY020_18815 [Burkholderiales bacterium]|nr:hypothetical protein [Burkholderiales bacterium]
MCLLLAGAAAQAADLSLRFDLLGTDGQRLPWSSAGPADPQAENAEVLGGGPGAHQSVNALVVRADGREAYALRGNGGTLAWMPQGVAGLSQDVAPAPELPPLSWAMAMAWDEARGVLMLVSSGVDAMVYRYDTRRHAWLGAHPLNYRGVSGLAFNAATGGFVAATADAELLMLDADGMLQQVHPLAGALDDLRTARKQSPSRVTLEGLQAVAQGPRVVLVNVYAGRVSHVWTYDTDTRRAWLGYRAAGLPPMALAASAAAHASSAAIGGAAAGWFAQALAHPSRALASVPASVQAWLPLAACLSLAMWLALLAWQAWRPTRSVARRRWVGVVVLALAAGPLLALWDGVPQGQRPLLTPWELWNVMLMLWATLRMHLPVGQLFAPDVMARIVATAGFGLALLSVALLLVNPRRRGVRWLLFAAALLLATPPAWELRARRAESEAFARELAAGMALFEERCSTAGATRRYAVGAVEGVRLTGLRAPVSDTAPTDRDWPDAGLPRDRVGDEYIRAFLTVEVQDDRTHPGWSMPGLPGTVTLAGYRFVDVAQPDGSYRRYRTASESGKSDMTAELIAADQAARYAVEFARIDAAGDRQHWVAGATVKVIDTQSAEVIGELTAFSHVPPHRRARGQPDSRNWTDARTCPAYNDLPDLRARMFTEEVLQRPRR